MKLDAICVSLLPIAPMLEQTSLSDDGKAVIYRFSPHVNNTDKFLIVADYREAVVKAKLKSINTFAVGDSNDRNITRQQCEDDFYPSFYAPALASEVDAPSAHYGANFYLQNAPKDAKHTHSLALIRATGMLNAHRECRINGGWHLQVGYLNAEKKTETFIIVAVGSDQNPVVCNRFIPADTDKKTPGKLIMMVIETDQVEMNANGAISHPSPGSDILKDIATRKEAKEAAETAAKKKHGEIPGVIVNPSSNPTPPNPQAQVPAAAK